MKLYLEALELRPPGDLLEAERVRLDVTTNTEAERAQILAALRDLMFGLSCQYSWHECYHDEGKTCQQHLFT